MANAGNLLEIQTFRMALQRSQSAPVRALAQHEHAQGLAAQAGRS